MKKKKEPAKKKRCKGDVKGQNRRAAERRTVERKVRQSEAVLEGHRIVLNRFRVLAPIGPPKDPARKARCRASLAEFCRTYLAASFPKPFSKAHLLVMEHLQEAVVSGGKFLDIVFREFGKTTLAEATVLYASAYGLRKFIVFVGADHDASEELLESIRKEWERNELLAADFPEVSAALDHAEGIPARLRFQMYRPTPETPDEDCHPTNAQWTGSELVYPWIDGAPSSGVVIASRSIIGRIRGLKRKLPDGTQQRPDFVVVDDPQDDESATSSTQVEKRLRTITRTILNLSGTKRPISVVIPSTILAKDDVIDQLSNPKLHGTWSCMKVPLVERWADKVGHDLWLGPYRKTIEDFDPSVPGAKNAAMTKAREFYVKNRAIMDAGAKVAWDEAYATDEVSAIQHAYNKLIELGETDFNCEFQGKPPDPVEGTGQLELADFTNPARYDGRARGEVPKWAEHLTAFVDVQLQSLFWIVCAWRADFTGAIVEYGIFPEQRKAYLRAADADPTLELKYPGGGKEGRWMQAFRDLTEHLFSRSWKGGSADLRIERLAIDANDGSAFDTVCDFCRASSWPHVTPWRSRGVGAGDKPFGEYHRNPGDKIGLNWRIPAARGRKSIRAFMADVNFWKTFVKHRLQTRVGDSGCLTLPGAGYAENRLLADHLLCEYGIQTEGRGRRLEEWRVRNPKNQENHWWDGLVACAAQASACGCALGGMTAEQADRKQFSVAGQDVLSALGG